MVILISIIICQFLYPILGTSSNLTCLSNQWVCGDQCIHRRSLCNTNGKCHEDFPRACGDSNRCYHRLDSCWEAACMNVDCQARFLIKHGEPMSELDRNQAKFLLRCPSLDARFSACPDPNYGHICFYSNEWACGNQCIGKTDICEFRTSNPMFNGININSGCDWGMKRCDNVCVDRHTPCHGICWDESSIHKCGDNMCLSQYQLQDYHVCNGTCYDHTVPCNRSCQSIDFFMCQSGDQCYRYWDHCDNEEHCDDGSDEGGTCKAREFIVYLVPLLMLLFIGSLVVMLVCVRVRGCTIRTFGLPWLVNEHSTTTPSSNVMQPTVRNQIQISTGEMVIMTNVNRQLPNDNL